MCWLSRRWGGKGGCGEATRGLSFTRLLPRSWLLVPCFLHVHSKGGEGQSWDAVHESRQQRTRQRQGLSGNPARCAAWGRWGLATQASFESDAVSSTTELVSWPMPPPPFPVATAANHRAAYRRRPTLYRCDTSRFERGVSLPRPPPAHAKGCGASPPQASSQAHRMIGRYGPFTVQHLRRIPPPRTTQPSGGKDRPGLCCPCRHHWCGRLGPASSSRAGEWSSGRRRERGAWVRRAAGTASKSEEQRGAPAGRDRCRGVRCPAAVESLSGTVC